MWALLRARQLAPKPHREKTAPDTSDAKYTPLLAMVVVGVIVLIGLAEMFQCEPAPGFHRVRMIVVLAFAFFLAMSIVIKEYLDNRELIGEVASHRSATKRHPVGAGQ